MKRKDIVSGIVLAVVGLVITQQSRSLTYRDEFGPGPGLLPFWLGLILFALALFQVAAALRRRDDGNAEPATNVSRVMLASAGFVAMIAAMKYIGFISSFGLLSFFLVYVVERRSLRSAVAVSLGMAIGFFLVFRLMLPVPLPLSRLGF